MPEQLSASESLAEIDCLIRARYPLIYIVSHEEERVLQGLKSLAHHRGKHFLRWTITQGLANETLNQLLDVKDPLRALDAVISSQESALFVLLDFHPYLSDPGVVRKLRDAAHALKTSYKTLLFLSPLPKIPPELEKTVALVHFHLPQAQDLARLLDKMWASLPDQTLARPDGDQTERIVEAALGLTAEEAENVFAKSLIKTSSLDLDVVLGEKEQIIRKSGVLEFYPAREQLEDIGGLEFLKVWLRKRGLAFSQKARDFGLPYPKGILLIGIPGCGKSLTAKAIGSLWKLPLLRLDMGKIFSGVVGSSEENMRRTFETAEAVAPSILWLDELEKGFAGTQSSTFSDAGTTARVFGTFITWLQEKIKPVFVVATANNVNQLPPELLRKGRFDDIFFVDLPNAAERADIFRIHLEKRRRQAGDFSMDELVKNSDGYSGSEIEQAVIAALYDAFEADSELSTRQILQALRETVPLSRTLEQEIIAIRQWAASRARRASTPSEMPDGQARKLEMSQ